jgi:hypothetical protein
MKDVSITCPECEGKAGWMNMDGIWQPCEFCEGQGWVPEDKLDEDEDDEE